MEETTAVTAIRKPAAAQGFESVGRRSGLTLMQARRIVAALRRGEGERSIAESEGIPERLVRGVRLAEFARHEKLMSAVGVAVGGMLDNVRTMHAEIDAQAYEELIEGAA